MNKIEILNEQKKVHLPQRKIKLLIAKILSLLKIKNKTLSLVFVDDAKIKKLNKIYRKKDKATDVLAFSMREGRFANLNPKILGDVVISVETAKKNAKEHKVVLLKEIILYITHGILHLLGYEDVLRQKKQMQKKENQILKKIWKEEN